MWRVRVIGVWSSQGVTDKPGGEAFPDAGPGRQAIFAQGPAADNRLAHRGADLFQATLSA